MSKWGEMRAATGLGRLLVFLFHVQCSCMFSPRNYKRKRKLERVCVANGRRRDGTRSGMECKRKEEDRKEASIGGMEE